MTRTPATGSSVSAMGIFLARPCAAVEKAGCEVTMRRQGLVHLAHDKKYY